MEAGKAAVAYVQDNPDEPNLEQDRVEMIKRKLLRPFEVFEKGRSASTKPDVNPNYVLPKQALLRLQKIMDEYCAGQGAYYLTNEPTLKRGLELLGFMKEDMEKLAARDLHDLLRCWEVWDRIWCAETHMRHILFREETRWPGYYYRGDFPKIDEENWKCFVNSRYDPAADEWKMSKKECIQVVS